MRLRWSSAALDDLDGIAEFNERRSAGWARRVQDAIIARAEALAEAPFAPVGSPEVRTGLF
jgi:plasmid stabilization system protein ParE